MNKNIYRIKLDIAERYYSDIVTCLYQDGLFDKLWEIRNKYRKICPEGICEEYPIKNIDDTDRFLLLDCRLRERGCRKKIQSEIKQLRLEYKIPINLKKVLFRVVTIGHILKDDYSRAYYKDLPEGPIESNQPYPAIHAIILHPAASKNDVLQAFENYLKINVVQTRTAKKINRKPSQKFERQSSKELSAGDYYHRLLTYIEKNPTEKISRKAYKQFCILKLTGSYFPLIIEELKDQGSEYGNMKKKAHEKMIKFSIKLGHNNLKDSDLKGFRYSRNDIRQYVDEFRKIEKNIKSGSLRRVSRLVKSLNSPYFDNSV